jgi:acyl-coenzyme A synthetase/AMP-(fatty) acid ligase
MGMVPELVIAMHACNRIGAPHSVVFGGFSAEALRDRINDARAKVLVTADGGYRRGTIVPLKRNADEAMTDTPSIEHAVVLKRVGDEAGAQMKPGATTGGMISWPARRFGASPKKWIAKTSFFCCTRAAPPENPRVSFIRPADISPAFTWRTSGSLT